MDIFKFRNIVAQSLIPLSWTISDGKISFAPTINQLSCYSSILPRFRNPFLAVLQVLRVWSKSEADIHGWKWPKVPCIAFSPLLGFDFDPSEISSTGISGSICRFVPLLWRKLHRSIETTRRREKLKLNLEKFKIFPRFQIELSSRHFACSLTSRIRLHSIVSHAQLYATTSKLFKQVRSSFFFFFFFLRFRFRFVNL